jgi:undecaprenyl-phosphate galactose phosphotransferase
VVVKEILARLGLWQCPTLLVGRGPGMAETRSLLQANPYLGYTVASMIDGRDANFGARLRDWTSALGVRCVFVVLDPQDIAMNPALVSLVENESRIPVSVMIDARGLLPGSIEVQRLVGSEMLVLGSRQSLWVRAGRLIKRMFDIVASAAALLLLSPLLLAIAALVRRDGGAALYGSARLGRGGRVFRALKFRSMVPDAEVVLQDLLAHHPTAREEWAARFKLENDPRVTRVGRVLRRTSLDELPQLVNVLRGEMSLVGPRPLLLEERNRYGEPAFALYCQATPGLTGIWQVSGRDHLEYSDRIRMNSWYVRNWSPWLDFVILLKTAAAVTRQVGSS